MHLPCYVMEDTTCTGASCCRLPCCSCGQDQPFPKMPRRSVCWSSRHMCTGSSSRHSRCWRMRRRGDSTSILWPGLHRLHNSRRNHHNSSSSSMHQALLQPLLQAPAALLPPAVTTKRTSSLMQQQQQQQQQQPVECLSSWSPLPQPLLPPHHCWHCAGAPRRLQRFSPACQKNANSP